MDDNILFEYYKLGNRMQQVRDHLKQCDWYFWNQSFEVSPLAYDSNGNKISPKPFYRQVDDLVDNELFASEVLNFLGYKYRKFNLYLASLNKHDQDALSKRYQFHVDVTIKNDLLQKTISECEQIEEASGYRYGFSTDKAMTATDDYNKNLDDMLAMFSS